MDELNERQQSLVAQVEAGKITEEAPDTQEQLLGLARHGLIEATENEQGWWFKPARGETPAEPEPSPDEQTTDG